MAIINTLRMRNILVRGEIAREEPADEFVEAMDDDFANVKEELAGASDNFVTHDAREASENRVLAAISDLGHRIAERDAERARESEQRAREDAERAAERDRQIHNHITIGIGLIIGAITIATAVISIVIVVID